MKIDVATLVVLKNFANINQSILIKEGNVLETISSTKTIKAKAKVTTEFPSRFAIYNLGRFISTLTLFNDPNIDFKDKYMVISDGNKSTQLTYSDESTIIKVPEKDIKLPSVDVSVKLTNDNIRDVEKALSVLSLPNIVVHGDGKNIYLRAADVNNPSGDIYSIEVGQTDKTFNAVFKSENIKILPGDYEVNICSKGISQFVNESVEYFIAVESSSTF